eukprot:CAMPEP_0205820978 /NCGR_PEP_ID=MMETSP0206-20130828/4104_1 /ASSEMBLY_ACC=CAM_ASM_000279 /TAXON_ID=36767 /ORGANISM="Euplotes focardii, Strain TN1" /LENGTH=146 /DNA_ID=CAMNT_0053116121 /DNA_START=31 /DNA_END=471 /DNA_ORIENTATION=+
MKTALVVLACVSMCANALDLECVGAGVEFPLENGPFSEVKELWFHCWDGGASHKMCFCALAHHDFLNPQMEMGAIAINGGHHGAKVHHSYLKAAAEPWGDFELPKIWCDGEYYGTDCGLKASELCGEKGYTRDLKSRGRMEITCKP